MKVFNVTRLKFENVSSERIHRDDLFLEVKSNQEMAYLNVRNDVIAVRRFRDCDFFTSDQGNQFLWFQGSLLRVLDFSAHPESESYFVIVQGQHALRLDDIYDVVPAYA